MGSTLSKPEPECTMVYYYCITYNENVIYVGRTFDFKRRMNKHKSASNRQPKYPWSTANNTPFNKRVREIGGWDMVTVKCVEKRLCKSRKEMCRREQHCIDKYRSPHLTNAILFIGTS